MFTQQTRIIGEINKRHNSGIWVDDLMKQWEIWLLKALLSDRLKLEWLGNVHYLSFSLFIR